MTAELEIGGTDPAVLAMSRLLSYTVRWTANVGLKITQMTEYDDGHRLALSDCQRSRGCRTDGWRHGRRQQWRRPVGGRPDGNDAGRVQVLVAPVVARLDVRHIACFCNARMLVDIAGVVPELPSLQNHQRHPQLTQEVLNDKEIHREPKSNQIAMRLGIVSPITRSKRLTVLDERE